MKGLTPEERRIIRETMAQGEQRGPTGRETARSILIFSLAFILFVVIAYMIFS